MKKINTLFILFLGLTFNTYSQTLPNFSFENWTAGANAAPDQWSSGHNNIPSFYDVSRSTEHYEGMYSVRLECKIQGADTAKGVIATTRPGGVEGLGPAFAVSSAHTSLKGYYRSTPATGDSAQIISSLHKAGYHHSQGFGNVLAFGYVVLGQAATFTPFSAPYQYDSAYTPDSGFIELAPYEEVDLMTGNGQPVTGNSILWVDALSFDNWIVGNDALLNPATDLVIYPNPSQGDFRCRFNTLQEKYTEVRVFDMQGRLLKAVYAGNLPSGNHEISFSLSGMDAGNYLFLISTADGYRAEHLVVTK